MQKLNDQLTIRQIRGGLNAILSMAETLDTEKQHTLEYLKSRSGFDSSDMTFYEVFPWLVEMNIFRRTNSLGYQVCRKPF